MSEEREPQSQPNPASDTQNVNRRIRLGWRGYLALFIASLETLALPLLIFIIVIFGLAVVFTVLK